MSATPWKRWWWRWRSPQTCAAKAKAEAVAEASASSVVEGDGDCFDGWWKASGDLCCLDLVADKTRKEPRSEVGRFDAGGC